MISKEKKIAEQKIAVLNNIIKQKGTCLGVDCFHCFPSLFNIDRVGPCRESNHSRRLELAEKRLAELTDSISFDNEEAPIILNQSV